MSVNTTSAYGITTCWWACDGCGVESAHYHPAYEHTPPLGWASLDRDGHRLHLCAECRFAAHLDPGHNEILFVPHEWETTL
jgi:hypothetical protein